MEESQEECRKLVRKFLSTCKTICFPVAQEKTEWPSSNSLIVFLGVLLDGRNFRLCVPIKKRNKALNMLQLIEAKKKATVKELQRLTGTLNFLTRIFHLGRTFTRCMYAKYAAVTDKRGKPLKHYHHVKIDDEFKNDYGVWKSFLENSGDKAITRPFIDFENTALTAQNIGFYTDATAAKNLGLGCYFDSQWTFARWEHGYIEEFKPSIEYLELLALCIGIFVWRTRLTNMRVIVNCDNESVVHMVNNGVSTCKNCMYLLRLLCLNNLQYNRRVFAQHLYSEDNYLADSLSRMKFREFFRRAPNYVDREPQPLPHELWPVSSIWVS